MMWPSSRIVVPPYNPGQPRYPGHSLGFCILPAVLATPESPATPGVLATQWNPASPCILLILKYLATPWHPSYRLGSHPWNSNYHLESWLPCEISATLWISVFLLESSYSLEP